MYKIIFLILFLLTVGCSDEKVFMAKGEFIDNQNNKIGFVEIMQQGNGSNIKIFIKGMSPDDYYFNFHDKASCNSPDFDSSGNKLIFFDDRENLYKFRVSKEINRYTGKVKDFNKILFIENIILDSSQSSSLLDSDLSSIIISKTDGTRIICSEIYPNY